MKPILELGVLGQGVLRGGGKLRFATFLAGVIVAVGYFIAASILFGDKD